MFLTTKSRYAVMAMVEMSIRSNNDPIPLADIAAKQEIDLLYLEQIFTKLKKKGLVIPVRGPGGGYKLARPGNMIILSDIINAAEEKMKMTRCSGINNGCKSDKSICLTHNLWESIEEHIKKYLNTITLDDIKQIPRHNDQISDFSVNTSNNYCG